jgi:chromosomal replication initiation ATPase DnaA
MSTQTLAVEVVTCDGQTVMVPVHRLAQACAGYKNAEETVSVALIQRLCCRHFGISIAEIRSSRMQRATVHARHVAMYLCRELTSYSYPTIARRFGDKDHGAVIYASRKIDNLVKADKLARAEIELLRSIIVAQRGTS